MSTKPSPHAIDTSDLDQNVLAELNNRLDARTGKDKYIRACLPKIRELLDKKKCSMAEVCDDANMALKKLGGRPVTPVDIQALLDEADTLAANAMILESFSLPVRNTGTPPPRKASAPAHAPTSDAGKAAFFADQPSKPPVATCASAMPDAAATGSGGYVSAGIL